MKRQSLSPKEIWDFAAPRGLAELQKEMAHRGEAWDSSSWGELLPNPDPVLNNLEDGGVEILEALSADAHVMSVIQTRKLGSLRKEFRYVPGSQEGKPAGPQDEEIWRKLSVDLKQMDLYNLISQILDAPYYGMVPIELIWQPGADHLCLKEIRPLPARWFGFDRENQPRFLAQSNPLTGQALPKGKFVLARHFPSYDNPYGLRLLSRCLWPTTFKKGGVKFWVMLAEKYGVPFLLGKYPAGSSDAEQEQLLGNLAKAVRDAVLVMPAGSEVELMEATKGGNGALHRELVAAMNREISKVILGQNLTTEVQGGSLAASKTHLDVLSGYLEADQKLVANVMNEIARIYTQINLPQAAPPIFQWYEEDELNQQRLERDLKLKGLGVRFSPDYLSRYYSLQAGDADFARAPKE